MLTLLKKFNMIHFEEGNDETNMLKVFILLEEKFYK